MAKQFNYYIDLSKIELAEGQTTTWLHAMPVGNVTHPIYGEIDFSATALAGYARSVKNRVLGTVDPVIDYDHMRFKGVAAGWVKDAEVRLNGGSDDGLQLLVDWTPEAVNEIRNKKYRYFSPTFDEEWEGPDGTKYKHVIFGGGITNRPYLKNLVPLNLSELEFDGLTDPEDPKPQPTNKGEQEVDIKKLAVALGLGEDAGEEAVYKKLGELASASQPPAPPAPPTAPPVVQLFDDATVKKLAETNPAVKSMMETMQALLANNQTQAQQLAETAVTARINELDTSTVVFTPAAKDLAHDIALKLDAEHQNKLFDMLMLLRDNNAVVVELGERGRSSASYVRDTSAEAKFNELVKAAEKDQKLSYADAVEFVARANRGLYDQYRAEVSIVKTA